MNEETARKVIALLQESFDKINDSIIVVQQECSDAESKVYRKACGKVLAEIFDELELPIFKEHPDLKPEGLDL